jgi:hypothetical protein
VPVLIGFLRQYAAASRSSADAQVDALPAVRRLNDDAHIRSTAESAVPICLDRHNFATDAAVFVENATTWTAAEATDAKRPRGAMGNRLQKSWANAGAFSLLTPRSKLAQY